MKLVPRKVDRCQAKPCRRDATYDLIDDDGSVYGAFCAFCGRRAARALARRVVEFSELRKLAAKHAPKPPPPAPPPNVLYRGGNPRPLIPPDPGKTTGEYAPTWFSLLIGFLFGVMVGILFVLAGMVT